ncbi:S9 family peptidase [Lysobacter auxotrophicus]|nr:S9 family peptidase [Lysobacter auxotrophicus]
MTKAIRVDDLYLHTTIQALHGADSHATAAFLRSQPSRKQQTYLSTVWTLDTASDASPRVLTSRDFPAQSPVLSPDGSTLAFLSARGRKNATTQVHVLSLHGGEARCVTSMEESLGSIAGWSADGKRLLVSASVPWAEDERDDASRPDNERPIVVNHLPYKLDGSGAAVGKRKHVFSVDVQSGDARQLTRGDFDVKEAQWSPDGKRLAFVRTREGRQRHRHDLWIADAQGADPKQLTTELASVTGIRWSPDGTKLVFGANRTPGNSLDRPWLIDVASGALKELGGDDLHLEGDRFVWNADGVRVATIASIRGMQEIAVIDCERNEVRHFARRLRHVLQLGQSNGRLLYTVATMRRPEEVFTCDWDDGNERRHTALNAWARKRERPRVSVRRFDVPDGEGGTEQVDAWILRPQGEGPFPVLVDMHGGPQSTALIDLPSHVYWYELVARGWMIVAPNAVGSGSYGTDFAKRLIGRWGELDFPQHLAILDRLRADGLIDDRIACAGKSYGGFLSAWAVGHSDAFRAAVVSAPVANIESHAGTSDTGFYVTPYAMGGEIDQVRERYHRLSPVEYCRRADAAVLLLQGQDDERCPLGQSEEMVANLVRCSTAPVRMVVYPRGSHGMAGTGNLAHRVDYHTRLADWVCEHAGTRRDASSNDAMKRRDEAEMT